MELDRGDFTHTRNHWWWRPGWRPGSRYATFHLTFESLPCFRGGVDLALLLRTVENMSPREVVVERPTLSLIELGRDDEVYTWRVLSQYALLG